MEIIRLENLRKSYRRGNLDLPVLQGVSLTVAGVSSGGRGRAALMMEDAEALRSECSILQHVAPSVDCWGQVIYGNRNWRPGRILGATPDYLAVRNWPVEEGDPFTMDDVRGSAAVCLVGRTVADKLFGTESPLGKELRLRGVGLKIVGILGRKGANVMGQDQDDFKIRDHTEISETFAATSRVMTNLLLVVALISLVVGGVGIMNIMLVSVTERTREIGIRMAVGARARDILRQFLIEAVVLCMTGGVVGILLGRGVSVAITALLHWPTLLSLPAIIASVVVSCTVGILFGFYPAWKASSLDPIEALRYE